MSDTSVSTVFPPGDFIREELDARGWTQADLAAILGRPVTAVNQIIVGKRAITPESAKALGEAFGTSAEFWMNLESLYRLSVAPQPANAIRERAKLFDIAPIKEMQKRGWIAQTNDIDELRQSMCDFFRVPSLDQEPAFAAAARQSVNADVLSADQIVWCIRAYHLARVTWASDFSITKLKQAIPELRAMARQPESAAGAAKVLAHAGVRLVLIEHLHKSRIDGAALHTEDGPIIAMSLRYDRIDYFWHTLLHEVSHILHGDVAVDVDLASGDDLSWSVQPAVERRANDEAAAMLIPSDTLRSFILRVKPLYSKKKINQFANLNQIHPGILVGQLQHRKEIQYRHNREMLVPVNKHVVGSTTTDGWGHNPKQAA